MTGRDLISGALRLLGVLASGESPSASEATDGLSSLNDMLDSLSTERLMIPNTVREVFPLVGGQQSYTMGPAGNFNTTRPIRIESALIQVPNGASTLELPLKILTEDEYASLILKQLQSTYPQFIYSEGTFPLETISLWPVSQAANNLVLYSQKQLTDVTDLSATIVLPPGYNRALRYLLAVELAPEYGKQIPEAVAVVALESKSNIKRLNSKPKYLQVDNALRSRSSMFNIFTGEPV